MKRDFDQILDECIDRINSGESVEECLKLYPESAPKLEPFLRAAVEFQNQITFVPSADAKAKGRARLQQEMAGLRQKQRKLKSSFIQMLFGRPKIWAPATAMLLLIALGLVLFTVLNPSDVQALHGTLQSVDSVSGTVTVKLKDGSIKTFNFTDISVATISQALGSASLEIGDQVTIKQDKHGEVKALKVKNADVEGTIGSLGTDSVTITTGKKGDVILQVTTETVIQIKDKGSTAFSDLQASQKIEASYDVASKKALRINVNMNANMAEGEIQGIVKAINADNKTVTLNTEKKGDITLQVTPDARIRIGNDGRAAFSDLRVGQNVQAGYDVASMKALKLVIAVNEKNQANNNTDGNEGNQNKHGGNNEQGKDLVGTIKALSADNKTVTITTEKKGDITLQITPDTRIRIGDEGRAAFSDDLRVGQTVQAGYDAASMKALKLVIAVDQKHQGNKKTGGNAGNQQQKD